MDRELLAQVAGVPVPAGAIEPATLGDHRRTGVVGRSYPILRSAAGHRADGILVHGLGLDAERRLIAYEGANYRLADTRVTTGRGTKAARVFLYVGGLKPSHRVWRLEVWRRRWKRRALRRAARLGEP